MKEVVDPVTDDDVRCGAGTKGKQHSKNILPLLSTRSKLNTLHF